MKLIFIILLTVIMIFYGGQNKIDRIEYDKNYYKNINSLILYEKKICKTFEKLNDTNILDITNKFDIQVIPNIIKAFCIKINPKSKFDLSQNMEGRFIMIVFNNTNSKLYLELNHKYLYKLTQKISIVDSYDIYNNSVNKAIITIIFIKKPFWNP
jgi:hypothetical protein